MNVFWDLDGTLVNPNERIYNLFCELTGYRFLSHNDYWDLRYRGLRQSDMLKYINYPSNDAKRFSEMWLQNIERKDLLQLDSLQLYVREVLASTYKKQLKDGDNVHQFVVTNRQNYDLALWELSKLGIIDFFDQVFVTEQKCSKRDIIIDNIKIDTEDIIVGDSEEDIITGKMLNIVSVAVCIDCRLEKGLLELNPDYIISDRRKIVELFLEKA